MDSAVDIFELLVTAETHLLEVKKILGKIEEDKTLDALVERSKSLLDEYKEIDLSLRAKNAMLLESLVAIGFLGGASTRSTYINGTYFTFISTTLINSSTKGWGVREEDIKITTQDFFSLLEKRGDLVAFFTSMLKCLNQDLGKNLARRTIDGDRISEVSRQLLKLIPVNE